MSNVIKISRIPEEYAVVLATLVLDKYYNNTNTQNIDVYKILKLFGFKLLVSEDTAYDDTVAFLSINNCYKYVYGCKEVIYINTKFSEKQIRYALINLLGKYFINYSNQNSYRIECKTKEQNTCENALSDIFTLNILMPREQFINKYNEFKTYRGMDRIEKLKQYFNVSHSQIQRYIHNLGLNKKEKVKVLEFKKI